MDQLLPNFIIGGAPKAATSSVFTYLAAHPEVIGSYVKETNFFLKGYTGEPDKDRVIYSDCFKERKEGASVIMEATPGYLVRGDIVAPRMREMLADLKLLFILRDPVDRLYSHYNYNLHVISGFDASITFEEYVECCMLFSDGKDVPKTAKLRKKNLRDIETGKYAKHLEEFLKILPEEGVKVMFYEDLKRDVRAFMGELCLYLGIDASFFNDYTFERVNATTVGRVKGLHKVANKLDKKMEFYSNRPKDKKGGFSRVYKFLNQKSDGYPPMQDAERQRLNEYYAPYNRELKLLLKGLKLPPWLG